MRLMILAAFALLCIAPLTAQAQDSGTHNRGATCPQRVPCASETANWPASDFTGAATQCLSTYLGYSSPGELFEAISPDGQGCLTTKSQIQSVSGNKVTLVPHCCITPAGNDNSCHFRCELINIVP